MSEQTASETLPPPPARISWRLAVAVIILVILPALLPFPLFGLAHQWIETIYRETARRCDSSCLAAIAWGGLEMLVMLGPSLLVGVASILLGRRGLARARRHPTSPADVTLFWASIAYGGVWAGSFGSMVGAALLWSLIDLLR